MTTVLVTNDDGIDAPGLHALADAAREAGFDVRVVAPSTEHSGMSAALTAVTRDGGIVVEHRPDGLAVGASPAYIVLLARIGAFGEPPDLVLSGINRGANAGDAVLHSGTVGAALTAGYGGLRAMAVSLDVLNPVSTSAESGGAAIVVPDDAVLHWRTAATQAASLLPGLAESPPGTVLNLNVPDRETVEGLREATLARFGQVQMVVAESTDDLVRTTVVRSGEKLEAGSDLAWLAAGYATVTAIVPPAEAAGVRIPSQRTTPSGPAAHSAERPSR